MNYSIYKSVRDAAWSFLLENRISCLPIRFGRLCEQNNILLLRDMNNYYLKEKQQGAAYIRDNQYHILVNGKDTLQIQRFTIAHELGHIYLKHNLTDSPLGRSFGIHYHPVYTEEYQAERFAMDILAPACVLWSLDLHSAESVSKLCNISLDDARYRADRMRVLYKRNKFLTSHLEIMVCKQFEKFISEYRK